MKPVFGDTLYLLALVNSRDLYHERAVQFARRWRGTIVTTRWVLAEVCDGLCGAQNRSLGWGLARHVGSSPNFRLLDGSDSLFDRGLDLYQGREDKTWSLTDCISFVVMADAGLSEALTADRHFQQAGFAVLLA